MSLHKMDFYGAPEFELRKCSLNSASKDSPIPAEEEGFYLAKRLFKRSSCLALRELFASCS